MEDRRRAWLPAQKRSLHATERDTEANRQRREVFIEQLRSIASERLVFLNESGVSTQMTKRYARARRGRRIAEATPEGNWKILTILGAMSVRGMIATMTVEAATDEENVLYTADNGDKKQGPEQRIVITGPFDFFDMSAKELAQRATLRYGLPRKLAPILESSGRLGRIKAEVVCSMTSKYAIALYELLQLRANMERCVETFPIDRFRELLGVPPGTYSRADNFQRKVLDPAVLEVNGLSDMSVQIETERRHSRAPIRAVSLGWWQKSGDEFRAAIEERNRSKLGRMARLKGMIETAKEPKPLLKAE